MWSFEGLFKAIRAIQKTKNIVSWSIFCWFAIPRPVQK